MPIVRSTLKEIYAPIETELHRFSESLKKELSSDDVLIQDIHQHLLKMTGKFLRPALAIFSSKADKKNDFDITKLAVAIELIHTATLVHDDIIDDSNLRRNQPAVHSKWGKEISIVTGDYLYAKAFRLFANFQDVWISRAFATCAHEMCEGEMKQIEKRKNFLMSESDYLRIVHQKTAVLFQAACVGGAHLSGADSDSVERLGHYGFGLGMAFQIVDDCLDLTGEAENLGKATGLDISKSDVTLPILYLFHELDDSERAHLLSDAENGNGHRFERIRQWALEKKCVEKALGKAKEYVENAVENVEALKGSIYKDSLIQLAYYSLDRIR